MGEEDRVMRIDSFWGEYRFLSNFYLALVWYDGVLYPTSEHAYQAAKTTSKETRLLIRDAASAGKAKKLGMEIRLRDGWDDMRLKVMEDILRNKFEEADLRAKLLATGDAELVEGNNWGDTFYGECGGVGENNLGKLLMKIRAEIIGGTR